MGDISINFSREEFRCKGNNCNGNNGNCASDTADVELIKLLEEVRLHFGKPIIINSGHRCASYNRKIGGTPNSQHLFGRAADIVIHNIPPDDIYKYIDSRYPTKYGLGGYPDFCHIDTRGNKARW